MGRKSMSKSQQYVKHGRGVKGVVREWGSRVKKPIKPSMFGLYKYVCIAKQNFDHR